MVWGRTSLAAKSGPGVETAHCILKIVYCMGDNDKKTYHKFSPWSWAQTTFGRQKWSSVRDKEDRRLYVVLTACRHGALYSTLYLGIRH